MTDIEDIDVRVPDADLTAPASGPSSLAAAEELLDSISGVLRGIEDLPDYLDRVCHAVESAIASCDAVGVTVILDDRPRTAAYTTAGTLEIDALQYAVGDGPCLDAFRNRRVNHVDLSVALDRWPVFVAAAADADVRSLLAVPLVSGSQCFGALNHYGYRHSTFEEAESTLARLAASRAADAIASVVQLVGAHELAGQLESAMASRAVIEQAKGIIMGREGVDEQTAFELLRRRSQDTNVKVRTVAVQLVRDAQHKRAGGGPGGIPAGGGANRRA